MIVHRYLQTTAITYEWTDDADLPIVITDAEFYIDDAEATLITFADGEVVLTIPADEALTAGNHEYLLRAQAGGAWTILSAGLLRVKGQATP